MKSSTLNSKQIANRLHWIAALESGEYKQGRCTLEYNGKFCCLGVAQDLFGCDECEGGLDEDQAIELLGIPVSGDIDDLTQQDLINYNDTDELSFKAIAKILKDDTEKWS